MAAKKRDGLLMVVADWASGRTALVGDAAQAMPSSHARGATISMRNAMKLALALDATADIDAVLQGLDRVRQNGCRRSPREINDTSDLFSAFPLGTLHLTPLPADTQTKAAASQDPRTSPGTHRRNAGRWIERRPIANANSSNLLRQAVRRSITRRNVVGRRDESLL
jgi:hypothetical protein